MNTNTIHEYESDMNANTTIFDDFVDFIPWYVDFVNLIDGLKSI